MTRPTRPRPPRRARRGAVLSAVAAVAVAAGVATIVIAVLHRGPAHPAVAGPAASSGGGTPSSPVAPSADCVAATAARLTPAQQVGQLLMVGTPVGNPTAISTAVRQYHLGGVFLAGRSSQSAGTLRTATTALQSAAAGDTGVALQIALDQEGGTVQTLSGPDFPTIPSAVVQGAWSDDKLRERSADTARRLRAAGITMNLAPVADTVPVGTAAQNPPIGALNRQYGADPATVAPDIATVVGAAQGAGVLTTIKHFPGLGRVKANTDTSTAAVDALTTAEDPFLDPFIAGIHAGTAAVMISSARYPRLDSDAIAAFSPAVITDLLRKKLGFTGMVLSDDLGAAKAASAVPVGERAVRFVRAGGDVVLTVRSGDAAPMSAALLAAAQQSPEFAARVRDAVAHVLAGKARLGLLSCGPGPSA